MKMNDKKREQLYKKRLSIQERIGNPERMSLKRAEKAVLKRFFHDPTIHKIFIERPDMTKSVGIDFCKKVKNPRNWFLLFDHEVLKFSVPEMFYWAILADKNYNSYSKMAQISTGQMSTKLFDFSILSKILERKDVLDFVKKESIVKLLLLKIKLENNRLNEFIGTHRKDIWEDPKKIIPVRFFSLLMVIITYLPLKIILSFHLDTRLQVILNKKR
jgi:hypothetical protein